MAEIATHGKTLLLHLAKGLNNQFKEVLHLIL